MTHLTTTIGNVSVLSRSVNDADTALAAALIEVDSMHDSWTALPSFDDSDCYDSECPVTLRCHG